MAERSIFDMYRERKREDNEGKRREESKDWRKDKYEKLKTVLKHKSDKKRKPLKLKKVPHTHAFGGMLYKHW